MPEGNSAPTLRDRLSPLVFLSNNLISRIGVVLVTLAGVLFLLLLPTLLSGHAGSAYIGILIFVILPAVFFLGLALIPLGIWRQRKKAGSWSATGLPPLNLQNPHLRRLGGFIAVATLANVLIGSTFTYRAVEHMESVQFCGTTCHTVMKPEYTAYQHSPHSKVACTSCHIGPGASWFVKSKLSGAWQVIAVTANIYPRPIPTPVENLRPARDTCEGCHWPDKYGADRIRVIRHFSEEGKMSQTVLLMHIGGGNYGFRGIHGAHVGRGIKMRYATPKKDRQEIPYVEYERGNEKRVYAKSDVTPEALSKMEMRDMDCLDCHNRPSHAYELPERALDNALATGELAADLPLIKKVGLELLKKEYATTEEGERQIPEQLKKFYREQHAGVWSQRAGEIDKAAKAVLAVWSRNIFPEMKVKWGTYPNNIGHTDWPGCFRCHDNEHSTKDGKSVSQDCNTCHQMLAVEEEDPKILADLGVTK